MNILISVNSEYLDKAETMLHSLRRNKDVTVYLLNHCLRDKEIKRLRKYLREKLNMLLEVIDVAIAELDQLPLGCERFSIEIYYRVLAQFLLPQSVERILWLDSDIIVCGDISEFYYQEFEENYIIACSDAGCGEDVARIKSNLRLPVSHIYFNSGVLLLNIKALREKTNLQEIMQIAHTISSYFIYPDQDLLNYLYQNHVKYCDAHKYNYQAQLIDELKKEENEDIVIFHYAGLQKPWKVYCLHELSKLALPYWKEVVSQGRWGAVVKIIVLYAMWMIYYKTGICNIIRKLKKIKNEK